MSEGSRVGIRFGPGHEGETGVSQGPPSPPLLQELRHVADERDVGE